MKNRFKQSPRKTKKIFRKTVNRSHKFNARPRVMRGGSRL